MAGKAVPGLVQRGTIDVNHRPGITNSDGTHSSIYSVTVPLDKNGKAVSWDSPGIANYALVPGIANGKFLTPDGKKPNEKDKNAIGDLEDNAAKQYNKTGEHLGIFKSAAAADQYANKTHAWINDGTPKKVFTPSY